MMMIIIIIIRYSVGTVKDSSDPWVVISEDDARYYYYHHHHAIINIIIIIILVYRFTNFFLYDKIIVYITAYNAAGHSEPLTIEVPLSINGIKFPYTTTSTTTKKSPHVNGGGEGGSRNPAAPADSNVKPYMTYLNEIVSSLYLSRNDITSLRIRLGRLRVDDLKAIIR